MNSASGGERQLSDWLLVALVATLPLMKPAVAYPVVLADLLFLFLAAAIAVDLGTGRRKFGWDQAFTVLAAYILALAASLIATPDLSQTLFKLMTEFYLAGLAAAVILVVDDEDRLRRVVLAWLAATAVVVCLAIASLIAFVFDPTSALFAYSQFHFGTLPPGHYPRLAMSFFNANMACNYLTVCLGLLLVAWQQGWLSRTPALLLLGGISVAAASTISPGLGGIALALCTGAWIWRRSRLALFIGVAAALAFLVAVAFTPVIHWTAPFVLQLPGGLVLAPSGRFLTWSAAWAEFMRYPLVGHGLGIDAVSVRYLNPSGHLEHLTDAHNVFLSIAAQAGIIGLAGLAALVGFAARTTALSRDTVTMGLGITFLNAFVYQGLSGSFEDTRHLWVLFGLLVAAARLPLIRQDGKSRRAGAPSPC